MNQFLSKLKNVIDGYEQCPLDKYRALAQMINEEYEKQLKLDRFYEDAGNMIRAIFPDAISNLDVLKDNKTV